MDDGTKTMNANTEAVLASLEPDFRARVEREMTAEVAWEVLKEALAKRYDFVPSKIEQRVHLMWIDGEHVDFKDSATKARMWVNVRTRTGDLVRDSRWTANVMEDYRTDGQLDDDWFLAERRTVERLKSVNWIKSSRDRLVEIYKKTHTRNTGAPMGQEIAALLHELPKEDRVAIEDALAVDDVDDRAIIAALEGVAWDEAILEQEAAFRDHSKYPEGLALLRRWKHAADAARRAVAMVEAQDVCAEIHANAWVTGSDALGCMLRDLAAPEERLTAAEYA